MTNETISGSCLCGQITYDIKNDFDLFHLCHCMQCQKTTGTAHASNLFTQPENLTWQSGEQHIIRYDLPGRRISNAFCGFCGSRLPYVSLSGDTLVVPAGTLNSPPTITPQANIFWPERAAWYDDAIQASGYPAFME